MQLSVLLVTDAMLFNSVTLRLGNMDEASFLSQPLYNSFVEGLAAIIPCPKENVFVFNIQVTLAGSFEYWPSNFVARRSRCVISGVPTEKTEINRSKNKPFQKVV